MGKTDTEPRSGIYLAAIGSIISFVCYGFLMGFGWTFQRLLPDNQLVFAAAVVGTIPFIFSTVYICAGCIFIKPCSSNTCFKDCIKGFVFIVQTFAAIVATVGAVMFTVAGATQRYHNATRLNTEAAQNQSIDILVFGLLAGMFGILTGIGCICTQLYWCILFSFNRFTNMTVW